MDGKLSLLGSRLDLTSSPLGTRTGHVKNCFNFKWMGGFLLRV